ncbi:ComEA family DNA-binding protein [Streptomyces roseolilacinus]|uniref:ComEA family DNA-binding protein n=1 Tax=Streptomyces roseolilacinus TaxID=66904 RepID=UPI0016765B73
MTTRTRSVIRRAGVSPRASLSTRPSATSGPGRARGSDGRARGHTAGRGRGRHRAGDPKPPAAAPPASAVRDRADALMAGTDPPRPPAGSLAPPGALTPPGTPAPAGAPTPPGASASPHAPSAAPPAGAPSTASPAGARERWGIALRERLPVWVQVRCGLERRTLGALAVVLVAGAVLAGHFFWTGRPETVHAPEVVGRAATAVTAPADPPAPAGLPQDTPATAPPGSPPTAGPPPSVVVVDVGGRVRRPGVLRLPMGARVVDALRAAGGVPPGTDTTGLNRARVLVDGEHVLVGVPAAAGPPGAPPVTAPQGATGAGTAEGPVSLNTATVEQLDTLPGVGPVLARHIIEHRARHGGFRSVEELRQVHGIGARRFADLRPRVRL